MSDMTLIDAKWINVAPNINAKAEGYLENDGLFTHAKLQDNNTKHELDFCYSAELKKRIGKTVASDSVLSYLIHQFPGQTHTNPVTVSNSIGMGDDVRALHAFYAQHFIDTVTNYNNMNPTQQQHTLDNIGNLRFAHSSGKRLDISPQKLHQMLSSNKNLKSFSAVNSFEDVAKIIDTSDRTLNTPSSGMSDTQRAMLAFSTLTQTSLAINGSQIYDDPINEAAFGDNALAVLLNDPRISQRELGQGLNLYTRSLPINSERYTNFINRATFKLCNPA